MTTTPPPHQLEDEAVDIVEKAALGLDRDVPPTGTEAELRAAAAELALDPDRLVAIHRGAYHPGIEPPEGVVRITTRWRTMTVNAYLVWDPGTRRAALFDTGADAGPVRAIVSRDGLALESVFVTHTHPDHIAALDAFPGVPVHTPAGEPPPTPSARPIHDGDHFRCGRLSIRALATPGHSPAGTSFLIEGLERPVVIVGDALFAGSMGRPNICYKSALESVRQKLFTLAEHTVICPGHGPVTSVGMERLHNPFFPSAG